MREPQSGACGNVQTALTYKERTDQAESKPLAWAQRTDMHTSRRDQNSSALTCLVAEKSKNAASPGEAK